MAVAVGLGGEARADLVVSATISNFIGTSGPFFGTLDLTTGRYTPTAYLPGDIAMFSLTSGPGGTLYAGGSDGLLYTISAAGVPTRFGSVAATSAFTGLAYDGSSGFYAVDDITANGSGSPPHFDQIAGDGNHLSVVNALPNTIGLSGSLAVGPDGALYYTAENASGEQQLYRVDPATGAATAVGSGLVTYLNHGLSLVTAGGQLYGIDTDQPEAFSQRPINIYTIDTATGAATATGVTVSGLANDYEFDAAAGPLVPVPEPSSLVTATMGMGLAMAGLWRAWRKGKSVHASR